MRLMNLRAWVFAERAHREGAQVRQGSGAPYITHCEGVCSVVRWIGGDDHMIQAALLHDSVEDGHATFEQIEELFGSDVRELVYWVSAVSRPGDGNRAQRKAIDLEHYEAAPGRAQTIKLADVIDNTRDISTLDPGFASVYLKEKAALVDALVRGHPALQARARKQVEEAMEQVSS